MFRSIKEKMNTLLGKQPSTLNPSVSAKIIKKREYKAPSFEFNDECTVNNINFVKHAEQKRYYYDEAQGCFVSNAPQKDSITMLFAGDLLCQENMVRQHITKNGYHDFTMCFDYIKPLLKSADFSAGNLETPISHSAPLRGEILSHEGPFYCNAPVKYLEALSYAGFDMLTTENNHTLDAGVRGLVETVDNCKRFGFIQTGTWAKKADKFVIVNICGFKVGFTCFGETYNSMRENLTPLGKKIVINPYSRKNAQDIYAQMKTQGAEYVVCFPHWGKEYTDKLSKKQLSMADELTSIGYDCVVGAHSHVIQKFAQVNNKPVLYSLGNLISHINNDKEFCEYTVFYSLTLTRKNNKIVTNTQFIPCKILRQYNGIPFCVMPVNQALELTEDKIDALSGTTETVAKRLNNQQVVVNTKFDINQTQLKEYKKTIKKTGNKVANLKKVSLPANSSLPAIEPQIPEDNNHINFIKYHKTDNGFYCFYNDHIELLQLLRLDELVTLPTSIDDKPVSCVTGNKADNNTTRLVYLGKKVETIEKEAFQNYTVMESIRMFKGLKTIKKRAFAGCGKMTGVILPDTLTTIEDEAFLNCSSMLSVKIPPSVKEIGENTFKGCDKLTVYCEKDSFAEKYAINHGISLVNMPLSDTSKKTQKQSKKSIFKTRFTVQELCNIIGEELPIQHKDIANDLLTNIAIRIDFARKGGAFFIMSKYQQFATDLLNEAIQKDVKLVICQHDMVEKLPDLNKIPYVCIDDPNETVNNVAHVILKSLKGKVVGVTGTMGKTTTKDFVFSVLSQHFNAVKSIGNSNMIFPIFNNFQKIDPNTEIIVQEFGLGATAGLMEKAVKAFPSNLAIITNIADSHLETYKTRENLLKEKINIVTEMEKGCPVFLNYDDELLKKIQVDGYPIISFAVNNKEADYYAENIQNFGEYMLFELVHNDHRVTVRLNIQGVHNVGNALVAYAVGEWFGMPEEEILQGIAKFKGEGIRQNMTNIGGYRVFIDCYNANPISILGGVEVLENLPIEEGGKRIAVIGGIAELGENSSQIHAELGTKIGQSKLDLILCFGDNDSKLMADAIEKEGKPVLYANNRKQLNQWIAENTNKKDIIMFKGSNRWMMSKSIDQVFGTAFHTTEAGKAISSNSFEFKIITEKMFPDDKTLVLQKYSGANTDVEIPSNESGLHVFSVATKCFYANKSIQKATIPSPIANISKNAFNGCKNLKSVTLPNTLKVIGDGAFAKCTSLEEITIPESVIDIGDEAFANCTNLKKVVMPASVGRVSEDAFANCPNVEIIKY